MKKPDSVWSRSYPNKLEIEELIVVMKRVKVSSATQTLVFKLASYPPKLRLVINLKMFLSVFDERANLNVLEGGLNDRERKALSELDAAGLSVPLREVGHGLLNVHERWKLQRSLSESFRQAQAAADQFIELKSEILVLDEILGEVGHGN